MLRGRVWSFEVADDVEEDEDGFVDWDEPVEVIASTTRSGSCQWNMCKVIICQPWQPPKQNQQPNYGRSFVRKEMVLTYTR